MDVDYFGRHTCFKNGTHQKRRAWLHMQKADKHSYKKPQKQKVDK